MRIYYRVIQIMEANNTITINIWNRLYENVYSVQAKKKKK